MMDANTYKRVLRAVLLAISFTIFSYYILAIVLTFPTNYPDKTLEMSRDITSLFDRITLPIKLARLSWLPIDEELPMPVYKVLVREIEDSWHAPRTEGRLHEGQDIFAARGTPVFSATSGYIVDLGIGDLGGNFVYIAGPGGRRYYYAHLDRIAAGLKWGQAVTTDTAVGFVGNTGDAENTPTHLHFGVYANKKAVNPLPLLVNRH